MAGNENSGGDRQIDDRADADAIVFPEIPHLLCQLIFGQRMRRQIERVEDNLKP